MKWIGYWMITVAVLHMVAAAFLFGSTYVAFVSSGFWGSVSTETERLALWFGVAAPMMFIIGLCLLKMQESSKSIGSALAITAIIGSILIPKSGFWLLIPPALGLIFVKVNKQDRSS